MIHARLGKELVARVGIALLAMVVLLVVLPGTPGVQDADGIGSWVGGDHEATAVPPPLTFGLVFCKRSLESPTELVAVPAVRARYGWVAPIIAHVLDFAPKRPPPSFRLI